MATTISLFVAVTVAVMQMKLAFSDQGVCRLGAETRIPDWCSFEKYEVQAADGTVLRTTSVLLEGKKLFIPANGSVANGTWFQCQAWDYWICYVIRTSTGECWFERRINGCPLGQPVSPAQNATAAPPTTASAYSTEGTTNGWTSVLLNTFTSPRFDPNATGDGNSSNFQNQSAVSRWQIVLIVLIVLGGIVALVLACCIRGGLNRINDSPGRDFLTTRALQQAEACSPALSGYDQAVELEAGGGATADLDLPDDGVILRPVDYPSWKSWRVGVEGAPAYTTVAAYTPSHRVDRTQLPPGTSILTVWSDVGKTLVRYAVTSVGSGLNGQEAQSGSIGDVRGEDTEPGLKGLLVGRTSSVSPKASDCADPPKPPPTTEHAGLADSPVATTPARATTDHDGTLGMIRPESRMPPMQFS